ncbi:MAG TPA: response regulator [Dissulfurispiraceae bacterium]
MKILIVDDMELIRDTLTELLISCSGRFEILTAENGVKAVEILDSLSIDLLITDIQMPEMNGLELLAYTARNHPEVPAIVMTASLDGETYGKLSALGICNYVVKPFVFEDLLEKIFTCGGAHPDMYSDKPLPDMCRTK